MKLDDLIKVSYLDIMELYIEDTQERIEFITEQDYKQYRDYKVVNVDVGIGLKGFEDLYLFVKIKKDNEV